MVHWRFAKWLPAVALVIAGCGGGAEEESQSDLVEQVATDNLTLENNASQPGVEASDPASSTDLALVENGTDSLNSDQTVLPDASADSLALYTPLPRPTGSATDPFPAASGESPVTTVAPVTQAPSSAPPQTQPPATSAPTSAAAAPSGGEVDQAEAASLVLLNELRTSLGLGTLSASDSEMSAFARDWSQQMRQNGFAHSTGRWAENIVMWSNANMTPQEAAAQFHDMWVNSPGHYANMTNGGWTVAGVGLYHDESGWWGTHIFR